VITGAVAVEDHLVVDGWCYRGEDVRAPRLRVQDLGAPTLIAYQPPINSLAVTW
jgi:hypothetical protein